MPPCPHFEQLFYTPAPVANMYWLKGLVGQGGYGCVMLGQDCNTHQKVALKIECGTTRTMNERAAYKTLAGIPGIPRYLETHICKGHGINVLEAFGHDLNKLMREKGDRFPVNEVYAIGKILVRTLQAVHSRGVVHRDIKPSNILLPADNRLEPYLVDFGHAQRYMDASGGHRPQLPTRALGTVQFMSLNIHDNQCHSRRDDITSLAYTLIYLVHGTLPWTKCHSATACRRLKEIFRPRDLTPPVPSALVLFLDHAVGLGYQDEPNYLYLEGLLC